MIASLNAIEEDTENFRAYVLDGDNHGLIAYDWFFTAEVDGVEFLDWPSDLLAGRLPDSVRCSYCSG